MNSFKLSRRWRPLGLFIALVSSQLVCNSADAKAPQADRDPSAQPAAEDPQSANTDDAVQPADSAADQHVEPQIEKGESEELDLATRLLAAQEQVAELKRRDYIEQGAGDEVRAKFVEALKQYDQLREDVLRRAARKANRAPEPEGDNFELLFNGVTSFVELPTVKYGGGPCTIEAIVSPRPLAGPRVNAETHGYAHHMAIIADTEFGGAELGMYPDRLSLNVMSEPQRRYVNAVKQCLPFVYPRMHLAGVIDDAEIRLYRDGKCVAKSPLEGPVGVSPFTMCIGCSPHPVAECHEMYSGRIDEVRISNSVRYSDDFEPQSELAVDENTVALYHFDEGKGDQLRDSSGNRHHGIIHDAHWVRVGE